VVLYPQYLRISSDIGAPDSIKPAIIFLFIFSYPRSPINLRSPDILAAFAASAVSLIFCFASAAAKRFLVYSHLLEFKVA